MYRFLKLFDDCLLLPCYSSCFVVVWLLVCVCVCFPLLFVCFVCFLWVVLFFYVLCVPLVRVWCLNVVGVDCFCNDVVCVLFVG